MLNKDTESMSQSVKHTTKYILNLWVNNKHLCISYFMLSFQSLVKTFTHMKKSKNLSNFFFEDMIIKCHHVFINPNLLKAKYPSGSGKHATD